MRPEKIIISNYGYTGDYKTMDCMKEYGVYKKRTKKKNKNIKDQKPNAVNCAYEKYKFKSGNKEEDYLRRKKHRGILIDYCDNNTTACLTEDENGTPLEQDKMCVDIEACDEGMYITEILPTAMNFFEIFKVLLNQIDLKESKKLLKRKKSRLSHFKNEQAQVKIIEQESIKQRYEQFLEKEFQEYKKKKNKKPETIKQSENGIQEETNNQTGGNNVTNENYDMENENTPDKPKKEKEEEKIMEEADKYDFDKALEGYEKYLIYKRCPRTKKIKSIIREYIRIMTNDLSKDPKKVQYVIYKNRDKYLDLLKQYLKNKTQIDELSEAGTFNRITGKVKRFSKKAWHADKILAKCNMSATKTSLGKTLGRPAKIVGAVGNSIRKPIKNTIEGAENVIKNKEKYNKEMEAN